LAAMVPLTELGWAAAMVKEGIMVAKKYMPILRDASDFCFALRSFTIHWKAGRTGRYNAS